MKKLIFSFIISLFFSFNVFAASVVNDGNINWDGNWQVGDNVKALHSSTNLTVNDATGKQSATWSGDGSAVQRGVLVYISSITGTGTFKVAIEENTGSWTEQQSTTLITTSETLTPSWFYFKFTSTEIETAGSNNYRINVTRTDGSGSLSIRADNAATSNIAIITVLDSTMTISASDITYITGIVQGATGNASANTVTMNVNDSVNVYGKINICNGGTLSYGTSASTSYHLKTSTGFTIEAGGKFHIGTESIPMPLSSIGTLEFTAASNINTIRTGGELVFYGENFTNDLHRTTLADSITPVGDRTFTTTDNVGTSGWKTGDEITVSGTNVSAGTYTTENKTTTTISGTSITIGEDWARTHLSGAEVTNLTRPVHIYASSTSYDARFDVYGTTTVNMTRHTNIRNNSGGVWLIRNQTGASLAASFSGDYNVFYNCTYAYHFANLTAAAAYPYNNTFTGNITMQFAGLINGLYGYIHVDKHSNINQYGYGGAVYQGGSTSAPTALRVTNSNIYGNSIAAVISQVYLTKFENCKFWESWSGYGGTPPGYSARIPNAYENVTFVNSKIGNDGTNDVSWSYIGAYNNRVRLYNTYVNCVKEYYTYDLNSGLADLELGKVFQDQYNGVSGRFKYQSTNGYISDQQTGGQAEAWAYGGSGKAVLIDPQSTSYGIEYEFYIPVTASTNPQLKFYVKKTSSSSDVSLYLDVFDSDDDVTKLIDNASITLTDSWVQYSVASFTPSVTGYVRCVLKGIDGSTTGDIGIDEFSIVSGGNTLTDHLDNWRDGLPRLWMQGGGGEGEGDTYYYQGSSLFNGGLEE